MALSLCYSLLHLEIFSTIKMRITTIVFLSLFITIKLTAQVLVDEGPKAYFGFLGLDSIWSKDLLHFDTLRMSNPNLKILRFVAVVSDARYNQDIYDGLMVYSVEGIRINNNEQLKKRFVTQKEALCLTIQDIEFVNSTGKLIKYPRDFNFKIYN